MVTASELHRGHDIDNILLFSAYPAHTAAREPAAVLATFDALEIDGRPLVDEPLVTRREHLERLLEARHPCLQIVEQAADVDLAEDWLKLLPSIEGVVAKRADRRYAPWRGRDW